MTGKPMIIPLAALFSVAMYLSSTPLRADERTSEYRIVGLFSPDRENDLHKALENIPELHLVHLDYETAHATFGYDLKALFPTLNPKKPPNDAEIELRLGALLAEASNQTFTLKPCSKTPTDKLAKVEIKIGILDCKGCRYGAHLIVMKEEGVEQAVVEKMVTALIDPAKTSQAAIEAALKKANVEVLDKK